MVQLTLIRARFITTIGHIIALLVLFTLMPNNIAITIARQGTGDSYYAYQTTTAALIIGCFCFAFDLSGFVMGTSIFNPVTNLIQIFFHFIGAIFLSFIIVEIWGYDALWPVVISCNFPTMFAEVYMLIKIYALKTG